MAKVKLNITIDEELMRRVDEYCEENFLNRSALFSISVSEHLNAYAASKAIQDMALTMRKIADSGKADPELLKDLEQFEAIAKMMFK